MENLVHQIEQLSTGEKYFFYKYLQVDMLNQKAFLMKASYEANDLERAKELVTWKKEIGIVELRNLLPFLKAENTDVKIIYLRILPVFFSYVTLYDMKVMDALKITEILRIHKAFVEYQSIFEQWFVVFQRRRLSKRNFIYKDEVCVRDLPSLETNEHENEFTGCVGYFDIRLFRSFHRWLRSLRLHKYLFLFANLTYEQIMMFDEDNIEEYEKQFDFVKITVGAKHKILREIERLRQRRTCLKEILDTQMSTTQDAEKAIRDIKRILRTPIPTTDSLLENIPQLLVFAINKTFQFMHFNLTLDEHSIPIYGLFISVLKEAWNYNIFSIDEKNKFNKWRTCLSDSMKSHNFESVHVLKNDGSVEQPSPIVQLDDTFSLMSLKNNDSSPRNDSDGANIPQHAFAQAPRMPFNQFSGLSLNINDYCTTGNNMDVLNMAAPPLGQQAISNDTMAYNQYNGVSALFDPTFHLYLEDYNVKNQSYAYK